MATIRVAIAGATGSAGEELLRLLLKHPHVQLTYLAASAKWDRPTSVSEVYPRFARQVDLPVESLDPARLSHVCDVAFLALPHGVSMALVPDLLASGRRVIDLAGDFRLQTPEAYPRWYKFQHANPALLQSGQAVYGLTEFHQEQIRSARLVANPGCYATSILLGVLPLLKSQIIDDGRFIVDAKSGLSGAGRKADSSLLFTEMTENLRAYQVNDHQHMPEVAQEIQRVTGQSAMMTFVPQVLPVSRGLVSTIYVRTRASAEQIEAAYQTAYPLSQAPFVRVRGQSLPQLRDVVQTNYCDIGYVPTLAMESLVVMSALDNLAKGAAGQAVQNFNLMCGFPETTGLL